MDQEGGTPLIIDTSVPFDDYIKSLSKPSRKNYKYVKRHNEDLVYKEVPFHKPDVERFMHIWSQQLIHGNERVGWAFDIGHVQGLDREGVLRVFRANRDDEIIAMHFVEDHEGYVECHPPMYDKKHNKRYLAKYMWFNLIRFGCENNLGFLDLGSGDRGTWRELVRDRKQYPRIKYKWAYIPQSVKENPELEKDYLVFNEYGRKSLREVNKEHIKGS